VSAEGISGGKPLLQHRLMLKGADKTTEHKSGGQDYLDVN
jgi:hypothetical protein